MPTLQEQLQETALVMKKSAESSAKIINILIEMRKTIRYINHLGVPNSLTEIFESLNAEINTSSQHTETMLEMYNGIIDKMAAELYKMQGDKDG